MFTPLIQPLFRSTPQLTSVEDVKYFIQNFYRTELKSDGVVCEDVKGDTASMRVATATLKQEVILLQRDAEEALEEQLQYEVRHWRVRMG